MLGNCAEKLFNMSLLFLSQFLGLKIARQQPGREDRQEKTAGDAVDSPLEECHRSAGNLFRKIHNGNIDAV